jgi:micrococcal nuclease
MNSEIWSSSIFDGTFLNALLVKEGYASAATFPPNVKYSEYFAKLQREARNKKRGMWKE